MNKRWQSFYEQYCITMNLIGIKCSSEEQFLESIEENKTWIMEYMNERAVPMTFDGVAKLTGFSMDSLTPSASSVRRCKFRLLLEELVEEGQLEVIQQPDANDLYRSLSAAPFLRYALFVYPKYGGLCGWGSLYGRYRTVEDALSTLPEYQRSGDADEGELVDLVTGTVLYNYVGTTSATGPGHWVACTPDVPTETK